MAMLQAYAAPPRIHCSPDVRSANYLVPVQRALLAQQEAQLAEQQRLQAAAAAAAVAGAFEQAPAAQPSPAAAAPVQPSAPPAASAPAQPLPNGLPSTRALFLLLDKGYQGLLKSRRPLSADIWDPREPAQQHGGRVIRAEVYMGFYKLVRRYRHRRRRPDRSGRRSSQLAAATSGTAALRARAAGERA